MTTIEEAREQAHAALAQWDAPGGNHSGQVIGLLAFALRALLDATEPSTVAVKTEFRVLDAPKDCDYHEGFEEGVKVGRAGSGPRPITDEMVERAISAHRFTNAFGPEEVTRMRAALEGAMAVNRG